MALMPRMLVIMGSGETTPTMVQTHRRLFERLPGNAPAVLLETPYGFQENADEISRRAVAYFAHNVGHRIEPLALRSKADLRTLEGERALALLRTAGYVFAGPGSPTYALGQWRDTVVPDLLASKLERGGIIVFASAAAVGLGALALPVYEIYKVGQAPHWVDGLDLVAATGLHAAVIPHYDNREGGTHDTRYCYLGARRLEPMEQQLPAEMFILGVDEHTALVIDLDRQMAQVEGRGKVTVRQRGAERTVPAGATLAVADLHPSAGPAASRAGPPPASSQPTPPEPVIPTLPETVEDTERRFERGAAAAHADAMVAAVLGLERALADWASDNPGTDEAERARSVLRSLIVRLGDAARDGLRPDTEIIGPYADAIVEVRAALRRDGAYELADRIRERAARAGLELRDTPEGTLWHVSEAGRG